MWRGHSSSLSSWAKRRTHAFSLCKHSMLPRASCPQAWCCQQPTTESLPLTFPLRPLRPSHSRGIHNHVESIAWLAGHFWNSRVGPASKVVQQRKFSITFSCAFEFRILLISTASKLLSRETSSEISPGHGVLIRGQSSSKGLAFVATTSRWSFLKFELFRCLVPWARAEWISAQSSSGRRALLSLRVPESRGPGRPRLRR